MRIIMKTNLRIEEILKELNIIINTECIKDNEAYWGCAGCVGELTYKELAEQAIEQQQKDPMFFGLSTELIGDGACGGKLDVYDLLSQAKEEITELILDNKYY